MAFAFEARNGCKKRPGISPSEKDPASLKRRPKAREESRIMPMSSNTFVVE